MDNNIKIKHPEYGYVEFSRLSYRQLELLKYLEETRKKYEHIKKTKITFSG